MKSLFIAIIYILFLSIIGIFKTKSIPRYESDTINENYRYKMMFNNSVNRNLILQEKLLISQKELQENINKNK